MTRYAYTLAIVLGCAGCATWTHPLTDAGRQVKIQQQPPLNCEVLGDIFSTGSTSWDNDENEAIAHRQLRNKTAAIGGNIVAIRSKDQDKGRVDLAATAYRCP